MKKRTHYLLCILSLCATSCMMGYPTHAYLTDEDPPFFSEERYIDTPENDVEVIPVSNQHIEINETE